MASHGTGAPRALNLCRRSYHVGTVSHPGNGPTSSFQPVEDSVTWTRRRLGQESGPVDLARRAVQHLSETKPIGPYLEVATIELITTCQENPENVAPLAI